MSPRSKKVSAMMRARSRDTILSASLELFAKRGYSATTTEQIARKAVVSKGLIFTHFKTKRDILFALFDKQFELILPLVFKEGDSRAPKERLIALIDTWLALIKTNPLLPRLSLQLNLDDEYRKIIRNKKTMKYFEDFLAKMTKMFKESGSENPKIDTYILMFFFDGIVANHTVAPDLFPIDAIKDHFIEMLFTRRDRNK